MVTWPIDPPASLRFAAIEVARQAVTGLSVSPYTLSQEAYEWPGQGWALSVSLPVNADRKVQRELDAFLAQLAGRAGTFRMALPDHDAPAGVTVNPVLIEAAAARADSIAVEHSFNPALGLWPVFAVGDVIEVGGVIHMVTATEAVADWVSTGLMDFTVPTVAGTGWTPAPIRQRATLWPRLRADRAEGDVVEAINPRGLWRLADDRQGYSLDLSHRSNSLKFVEAQ